MSSWQPDPAALQHVVQLLHMSGSPDSAVQRQLTTSMDEFKKHPLCANYLAYVVTYMPQESAPVRVMAALLLKNAIRDQFNQTQDKEYIKHCAMISLRSDTQPIRQGISIVITTIVTMRGLVSWPQIWPFLLDAISSSDANLVDGAFRCLEKIVEDIPTDLDEDEERRPLQPLLPKLIESLAPAHPAERRRHALACLFQLVHVGAKALVPVFDPFLVALLTVANDANASVRKLVCQILVRLLDINAACLMPHFTNLVEYMLLRTKDEDDGVAMEACEFWLAVAEVPEMTDMLHPCLPKVVPVLLDCMVYSEDDIAVLTAHDDDDEAVPDREDDIAPRHHTAKSKGNASGSGSGSDGAAKKKAHVATLNSSQELEEGEEADGGNGGGGDDDDDDEEDEEDDDDKYAEWNLRKCAASALDLLSTIYGPDILPHLLPLVEAHFKNQADWVKRESAILALGAVAEGCMDGLVSHLPQLIPFLLQTYRDSHALVRSITAWTISRFATWVCAPEEESSENNALYNGVLEAYLTAVCDKNKRVQEATISALSTVIEESAERIVPYLAHILPRLAAAFAQYQHKNSLRLLDCVGTLADTVQAELARPEFVAVIMPPIIRKWEMIPDDSKDLFPLLECLSALCIALGDGFKPFAEPVWQRCIRITMTTIQAIDNFKAAPQSFEEPDRDFLIVALDLISGLIQSLGPTYCLPLVTSTQPPLIEIVMRSYQEPQHDVRQSVFAIIGDLGANAFEIVAPHVEALLPILIASMTTANESVPMCNNAVWAAGEISMKHENMRPFAAAMVGTLIQIINRPYQLQARTLMENAAITLGRLAHRCADVVAPHLQSFIENWLKALGRSRDNAEKIDAFRGLVLMVQANPGAVAGSLITFVDALCFWTAPPADLRESFHKIVHAYRQMYGADWDKVVASLPEKTRVRYDKMFVA